MDAKLTVGGTNVELRGTDGIVDWGGMELRVPVIHTYRQFGDAVVLVLSLGSEPASEPDIWVPADRNLVSIADPADHRWTVAPPAGGGVDPERGFLHDRILGLEDRLVTRATTGECFEVDPETGEITDTWGPDEFVVGGERHTVEQTVQFAHSHAGVTMIVAYDDTPMREYDEATVYGVDADGTRLWQVQLEHEGWYNWVDDGYLYCKISDRQPVYRIDPRTGDCEIE